MANETEIMPALTAQQRKQRALYDDDPYQPALWVEGSTVCVDNSGAEYAAQRVSAHAVAALALDGQPFGFTRADVDEITRGAMRADNDGLHGISFNLRSIAARIAALLPPDSQ